MKSRGRGGRNYTRENMNRSRPHYSQVSPQFSGDTYYPNESRRNPSPNLEKTEGNGSIIKDPKNSYSQVLKSRPSIKSKVVYLWKQMKMGL